MYQFKAKDSQIKPYSFISRNILKDFTVKKMKKTQPVITTRIYVLHKITIALKFMSYINSDLKIPAKKLQTPG